MGPFRNFTLFPLVWIGGARILSAQAAPFGCSMVDLPPATMRFEGLTELTSDVVMTCTGGAANVALPVQIAFSLVGSVITSRQLGPGLSEMLLLVDEPSPAARVLGKNAFQGQVASSSNTVTWSVSLVQPGSGTRPLRITNIRSTFQGLNFNAALLGVVKLTVGGSTTTIGSSTFLGLAGAGWSSAAIDLRRCDDGAAVTGSSINLPLSGGLNIGLLQSGGAGSISFNVRLTETFASVFRNQQQEGGTTLSATDLTGKADHGTRLGLNIAASDGMRVFVTTRAVNDGTATSSSVTATLVSNASGSLSAVPSAVTGACLYSQ